jgi:hypothetical protein
VLSAEPGQDHHGPQARAVACGDPARRLDSGLKMLEVLAKVPAKAGRDVPSARRHGARHRTGAGTIFEIQQASDTTYRFWDWDRPGDDGKLRELHQDQALKVMKVSGPGSPCPPARLVPGCANWCAIPISSLWSATCPPRASGSFPAAASRCYMC